MVRVVEWGTGEMGQGLLKFILERPRDIDLAGCIVTNGRLTRGKVRLLRRKNVIFEGAVQTLRRFQDEVQEVRSGMECGIRIDGFGEFQEGDSIECFIMEKVTQQL